MGNDYLGSLPRRVQPELLALVQPILDQLAALPEGLRQTLADHQWSIIPLALDESAFSQSLAAGVPLDVMRQTDGLEQIESIVAVLPTGATGGQLTLGSLTLPVSAGTTVISPVRKLLGSGDIRRLSYAGGGPGPAALWLTGQQLATTGALSH